MVFDWDEVKAQSNFKKHGIDFGDAKGVFSDPWAIAEEDETSLGERRFNHIGMSAGRLLYVTCTWRDETCRIISARKATR